MNMIPGDILSEAQIITDLKATNRAEAIEELIDHLIKIGRVKPQSREAMKAAVKKREAAMTTGVGAGVGIPHASTSLVREPLTALGRSKQKINFDALDGQPVGLVILFLVPPLQFKKHLKTMVAFYKHLQKPHIHQALMQAPDAGAMLQIIKEREAS